MTQAAKETQRQPISQCLFDDDRNPEWCIIYEQSPGETLRGYVLWRHPCGGWVPIRDANEEELDRIKQRRQANMENPDADVAPA